MLQSMGSQRVGHDWVTELNWTEKILDSPLDSKKIKPVSPKGNQPWILIIQNNAEAEVPILWPPDVLQSMGSQRVEHDLATEKQKF